MPHVDTGGITAGGRGSLSPFWAGLFGIPQKAYKPPAASQTGTEASQTNPETGQPIRAYFLVLWRVAFINRF